MGNTKARADRTHMHRWATLRRHVITQPQRIPITVRVNRYVVSSVKPVSEQEYYRI